MRSVKLLRMMAILMIFIIISSSSFAAAQCYTIEGAVQEMIQEGSESYEQIKSFAEISGTTMDHAAYRILLTKYRGVIAADLLALQNEEFTILDIDKYLQMTDNAANSLDLDMTKDMLIEVVKIRRAISADAPQEVRNTVRRSLGEELVSTVEPAEEPTAESEEQRLERIRLGVEKVQELDALGERIADPEDAFTFEQAVAELRANEDLIIDALGSEDFETKVTAMEMLGRIGSEKSVSALQDLADSEDYGVASTARDILSQIEETPTSEPSFVRRLAERAVRRLTPVLDPIAVFAASTAFINIAGFAMSTAAGGNFLQDISLTATLIVTSIGGAGIALASVVNPMPQLFTFALKPISTLYHIYKSPPASGQLDKFFTVARRKTTSIEDPEVVKTYTPVITKGEEYFTQESERFVEVQGKIPLPILNRLSKRIPVVGESISKVFRRTVTKRYYVKEGKVYELKSKDVMQEVKDKEKIQVALSEYYKLPVMMEISGTDTPTARNQLNDFVKGNDITEFTPEGAEVQQESAIDEITPEVVQEFPLVVYEEAKFIRDNYDLEAEQARRMVDIQASAAGTALVLSQRRVQEEQADIDEVEENIMDAEFKVIEATTSREAAEQELTEISGRPDIPLHEKALIEQAALIERENERRAKARLESAELSKAIEEADLEFAFAELEVEQIQERLANQEKDLLDAKEELRKLEEIEQEHNPRIRRLEGALSYYNAGFYTTEYEEDFYAIDFQKMIAYLFNDESMTGKIDQYAEIEDVQPRISDLYNELLKTFTIPDYDSERDYLSEEDGQLKLDNLRAGYKMDAIARYLDMETEAIVFKILGEMVTKAEIPTYSTENLEALLSQIDPETLLKMFEAAKDVDREIRRSQEGVDDLVAAIAGIDQELEDATKDRLDALADLAEAEGAYADFASEYSDIDENTPISTIALAIPDLSSEGAERLGDYFETLYTMVKVLEPLSEEERAVVLEEIGIEKKEGEIDDIDLINKYLKELEERSFDVIYAAVPLRELDEYKNTVTSARRRGSLRWLILAGLLILPLLLSDNPSLSVQASDDVKKTIQDSSPEAVGKLDLEEMIRNLIIQDIEEQIDENKDKTESTKKRIKRKVNSKGTPLKDIKGDPINCGSVSGSCRYMCEDNQEMHWASCESDEVCCVRK